MRLKVYGWQGLRRECPGHHKQTREIVATTSQKKAAELAGYRTPRQLFNLCETSNAAECSKALSKPGVVFWKPNDARGEDVWVEVQP